MLVPTCSANGAGVVAGAGAGASAAGTCVSLSVEFATVATSRSSFSVGCVQQTTRAATAMEFTDDPFKDYRYEDPFNIEDPFADATDSARPAAVEMNGGSSMPFAPTQARGGRVSAPPVSARSEDAWAAWPDDSAWTEPHRPVDDAWTDSTSQTDWKTDSTSRTDWKTDNWASKTDAWTNKNDNWADKNDTWSNKNDNWANKSDNWAADWTTEKTDRNKNLNETWPSNTLPTKKEKSPKPVKYAKSLVHTIGGIGRARHREKKSKEAKMEARSAENLPSEEQQWAWAAAESRRLEQEAERRRRQEDAELQLALAISRQEK